MKVRMCENYGGGEEYFRAFIYVYTQEDEDIWAIDDLLVETLQNNVNCISDVYSSEECEQYGRINKGGRNNGMGYPPKEDYYTDIISHYLYFTSNGTQNVESERFTRMIASLINKSLDENGIDANVAGVYVEPADEDD